MTAIDLSKQTRRPPPPLQELDLYSIKQINALSTDQRLQIFHHMVPLDIFLRLGIDPETLQDEEGRSLVTYEPSGASGELFVRHRWDAEDPVLYLHLADTVNNQIEVLLFAVNDPHAERFDVDRLPDGTPTHFGVQARRVAEEIGAMEAGLAPGQVRRGLRLTRDLIPIWEQFVVGLHHDAFYIQPLAYHNAILFERLGFAYVMGLGRMEWIHNAFAPDGLLRQRLDGSTPFRRPEMAHTVRGRSWAIHDGIMKEPFAGVKMYKRVGVHAGVVTFPNASW
jgi:hypothetical protein